MESSKISFIILFFFNCSILVDGQNNHDFYAQNVSNPKCSIDCDGTMEKPFLSLIAANTYIRALNLSSYSFISLHLILEKNQNNIFTINPGDFNQTNSFLSNIDCAISIGGFFMTQDEEYNHAILFINDNSFFFPLNDGLRLSFLDIIYPYRYSYVFYLEKQEILIG